MNNLIISQKMIILKSIISMNFSSLMKKLLS